MAYVLTIAGYLVLLFVVGIAVSRRVKGKDQFLVAGRSLGAPVLVATLLATWIGSGDIFSVADLSYHHGYASLLGSAGGWVGIVIVFFVAGQVRRFGGYTVPDILEARYDARARVLATLATVIASVTIVSYQLRGGGWIINTVSDGMVSEDAGFVIMAIVVVVYTALAGMVSVAYVDTINGIAMICGVAVALPVLLVRAGGIAAVEAALPERASPLLGDMSAIEAAGYFVPTMLLALGNGNTYQRFFSARDAREARRAVVGWIVGVILLGVMLQSLAVIGSTMFPGLEGPQAGKIMLAVARHGLPAWAGCVLLGAFIAIVVSTANSFLLAPATNIVRDVYQRFVAPEASDRRVLFLSRATVVALGGVAYVLLQFYPRVLHAAYAAYTVYGAGVTPALVATFFWRRATAAGAVASILGGTLVTVGWEVATKVLGDRPVGLPAIFPALACSVVLLVLVSLATRRPRPEQWQRFVGSQP